MFTGLVDGTASVDKLITDDQTRMTRLIVANSLSYKFEVGDSIAVNGCCLTATAESSEQSLVFEVSRETLAKTNLGALKVGSLVNLEQAMKMSDRLDGHLVSGHVDTTARITKTDESASGWFLQIAVDRENAKFIIPKGSICLNGVSLTVNELMDNPEVTLVDFMLIPTTLDKTNLEAFKSGDWLNVEFDLVGKYILRAQQLD
jgi:riboflavin synthase